MKIQSTVRRLPERPPDVMIVKRSEAEIGGYIYDARPVMRVASQPIRFFSAKRHEVGSVIPAPVSEMQIAFSDDDRDAAVRTGGPDPKRQGEIPGEIRNQLLGGGAVILGTHVAVRGGPAVAAAALANQYGIQDKALTDTLTEVLREGGGQIGNVGLIGNILKVVFFALTLFGVGFKLLELVFGKTRPAWAVAAMCATNAVLTLLLVLWLFDLWPFVPDNVVRTTG